MRVWGVLVVAMTLSVSQTAGAVEGRLGLRAGSQYESNLFRQDKNPQDDFSFNVSPSIGFSRDEGRFEWDAAYRPTYRDYLEYDARDKWNHVANLRSSYLLGPRTRVSLFNQFTYTENTPNQDVSPNSDSASDVNTSSRSTVRNTLGLSLSQGITSRLSWSASGNYLLSDVQGGNRSNFTQFGASTQFTYALTRRNALGIGAAYSWVGFSDTNNDDIFVDAGTSETMRLFASWSYAFSDTLSFSINGGPARVTQHRRKQTLRVYPGPTVAVDPSTVQPVFLDVRTCVPRSDGDFEQPCSAIPGSALVVADSEVAAKTSFDSAAELAAQQERVPSTEDANKPNNTFFAEAQLTKRWRDFVFTASYRRSQNPESSAATTSIVDAIRGAITYRPNRDWTFGFNAGWNQRVTSNNQTVESTFIFRDSGLLGRPAGSPDFQPADSPVAEFVDQDFKVSNTGLDVTQYNFAARVTRRITDQFDASANFLAITQDSKSKFATASNSFDEYRVSIGFTYSFRPRPLF
jgi:hypothetical protein